MLNIFNLLHILNLIKIFLIFFLKNNIYYNFKILQDFLFVDKNYVVLVLSQRVQFRESA